VLYLLKIKRRELHEFSQGRQTLFLFLVLFLYRSACVALIFLKYPQAAGRFRLRLFCFWHRAASEPAKERGFNKSAFLRKLP